MSIKAPWLEYLHRQRKREIETVFSKCPEKIFPVALELGAGDGFQSKLLSRYVSKLIATDYNPDILKNVPTPSIEYRLGDAEKVGETFNEKNFDLIFSSSLLEHLPSPNKALKGIHKILKDEGITIHIIPTPFWKLGHLLLHIPNLALTFPKLLAKSAGTGKRRNNNPKTTRIKRSILSRILIPKPHGASQSNIQEFYAFSSRRWEKELNAAGLKLVKIIKGPAMSGYGFGWDFARTVLENLGLASIYIYIAVKDIQNNDFKKYF